MLLNEMFNDINFSHDLVLFLMRKLKAEQQELTNLQE